MVGLDLVKLSFIVEGHEFNVVLGGILDERRLLAGVGVDDA